MTLRERGIALLRHLSAGRVLLLPTITGRARRGASESQAMTIQIKNRLTQLVLWEGEAASIKEAVAKAVARDSDLRDSNLRGSNLSGSDLSGSDLSGSDLRGSDLRDSDLRGSDLRDSNLRGSDLRDSNLRPIRDDLWAVLSGAPAEAAGLLLALREGRVNGSSYEDTCACLIGTIANVRGCDYRALATVQPNASRPAERFFLSINVGDTPETNQFSKLAAEWIAEWIAAMHSAFGAAAQARAK